MVWCFAPGCNHQTSSDCKMFMMPADEKQRRRWTKLLSCRTDTKPTRTTYVCSCHFKDGKKENGPTIFAHNIKKQMSFSSPEKRTRKKRVVELYDATETVQSTSESTSEASAAVTVEEVYYRSKTPTVGEPINIEIMLLREKIRELEEQLAAAKETYQFSYNHIKNNNDLMKLYTGLPDTETFEALSNYLNCFQITYYMGWQVTKVIDQKNQLLITLMKLKLNCPHLDLATRFGCSSTTISNIWLTWVHLIHKTVYQRFMGEIPSQRKTKTCLPNSFAMFSNCRIILDCTEIRIAIPSNMRLQRETFSTYKHANTYKALVGVAPNGVIVFVSNLYPGSISDKDIFQESKVCNQLREGDMILVDKGFLIHDVVPAGVNINIPPFLMNKSFSRQEAISTLNIARCRIHIERANARIKSFRILNIIPASLREYSSIVFQVCCSLVNLQNPLIKEIETYLDSDD